MVSLSFLCSYLIINFECLVVDDYYHDGGEIAEADFVAVGQRGGGAEYAACGVDDAVVGVGRGLDVDGLFIRPYFYVGSLSGQFGYQRGDVFGRVVRRRVDGVDDACNLLVGEYDVDAVGQYDGGF